jgi:protein ImuB
MTMSEELYLCAFIKDFSVQALLRLCPERRSKPVVVMDGDAPFQFVCSLDKFARSIGVTSGMSRAELDSFPSVALLKRSIIEEQSARTAILECASTFSPRIEAQGSDDSLSLVLDISGTNKLFGNPMNVAAQVQLALSVIGISSSLATSANYETSVFMARGLSEHITPVIVRSGEERSQLASLPLSVLNLSAEHSETFANWGVTTLGTLAMLPERDLIARLGQEGGRLRMLARGEADHLFQPIDPVYSMEEQIELDSPVEILDSLLFGVSTMLDQLLSRARERILSLAIVYTELGLEGGGTHNRIVRPALPSNDKQLWLRLMHLDWITHPPQAAVTSMKLKAETGVLGQVQLGLFSPQLPESGRLDVTLARIRAVVGEERLGSIELKDTHEPDAFRMKEFSITKTEPDQQAKPALPAAVMRRLRPPEKVSVTLLNQAPNIIYFRGIGYQAECSYGPWHCAGGWWTEGRWSLEEWDVVARTWDGDSGNAGGGTRHRAQICCCMIHDAIRDRWTIEALYD